MIKKLVIAVTFAASMTVGGQPASASTFLCMQKYDQDIVECDGNTTCEIAAELTFTRCLQALADGIGPLDN